MKKLKSLTLALSVALGTTFFLNSCTQDPCKDVLCQNGGTCVAGACNCVTGYEGDSCQTESRTKFLGTWAVTDVSSLFPTSNYNITVTGGTAVTQINLGDLWQNFASSVTATVDGNSVTIPTQEPDSDGFEIESTTPGTITVGTPTTVTISYKVTNTNVNPNIVDNVNSTWTM